MNETPTNCVSDWKVSKRGVVGTHYFMIDG
jgi:hypothetical protein